ncbi:glycosyltransferase family 4 protein [Halomonas sp. hl-4]|uniref:glycosyltransferase family 4 protein n=1 Tax=Halomonas sp. hl-4 TaxID=1761789 RepID=UPI000BB908B4|nr:glycosyltransferase family 4 protein [Halomonas sp. hl-4]SNY97990.1 Glycosyltransferase involved in cell wall bisynthesis [Halomonas sp. hl-4]
MNLAKGFRGGEKQTVLLIKELSKIDEELHQILVCRSDSPMKNELKRTSRISFKKANNILDGHFSSMPADVLHAHDAKAVHWSYINKVMCKTPYLFTKRVDLKIKEKFANRLSYLSASAGVGISSVVVKKIKEFGVSEVYRIPDAGSVSVNNENLKNEIKQRFKNKFIVGHIGALVDRDKGQRVIIDAVKKINNQYEDFVFVLFGEGEDENILKRESQNLENVIWMGFEKSVGSYIPAFDAFVFPSRSEGMGSILIDVMAAGVPIVASNVGGIPDLISDKENGLLIENGDYSALAEKLIEIKNDVGFREALVSNALAKSKGYTAAAMALRYLDVYKKVLKK